MINVTVPDDSGAQLTPRIYVIGVGGAGGNAVNNMIQSNLEGVNFLVGNTDAQALAGNKADVKVQLGPTTTKGLGAGSRAEVGEAAAEESMAEIMGHLEGANMVFITAGMGGGTGTGAGPVIAKACREAGILTVGVVTKPFQFEGAHRMRTAERGIEELQQYVDTLIIIPNQNLFRVANEKTTFADAFKMADDVLHAGVRGVTDLMVMPGLINLDFADIKTVMQEMGKAMMGTGEATGERRATEAAEAAISNPLLEDTSMQGARGILINITGGMDMTLFEVDEAANRIRQEVDPDANIIFGSTFDESMDGTMRVSVVATGIDVVEGQQPVPLPAKPTMAVAKKPMAQEAIVEEPVFDQPGIDDAAVAMAGMDDMEQAMPAQPMVARQADLEDYTDAADYDPMMDEPAQHSMLAPEPAAAPPAAAMPSRMAPRPIKPAAQAPAAEHARPLPERRDDAFIPPAPIDPGYKPEVAREAKPDPFAAAALANGGKVEDKNRKRSLFDRVTGLVGRDSDAESDDKNATHAAPKRSTGMGPSLSREGRERPAPAPVTRPAAATRGNAAVAQPSLNIAPASPDASAETDEDMLDIPAFLRRQAN